MTVSSLWTVLDEAGCGVPVGIDDFNLRGRGDQPNQQTILAVDLSIWICEGITSTALSSFHSDPVVHLVYQRAVKLLKLGVGLVFVVEGKRRVRTQTTTAASSQTHELKQRRAGSQFWHASNRCESMLQGLGVPVVRADAEGEALCALLNSRGLVDGVISNDGDCLLFGAKTIYTGFSAENLEARKVMRYDSNKLLASVDGGNRSNVASTSTIKLSREDLIAFAVLTGSDLVGDGLPHVGHRKAIQYLHACRSVKHPSSNTTCLDELLSWSDASAAESIQARVVQVDCDDDGPCTLPSRCCSICLHQGDKKQHEKHGCSECGTGPGEGCIAVTANEKFLRSLKEKAKKGSIAPRHIVNGYCSEQNVPHSLCNLKTKPYTVSVDAAKLYTTSLILKGRTTETSLEHIKQTLPKLLARLDLWATGPRNRYATTKQLYKPIPAHITKKLVKQSMPCYEVVWSINIDPTTSENELFRFSTVECQSLIDSIHPQLVTSFHREERRRLQGRAKEERDRMFFGGKKPAQRRNKAQRRDITKKPQNAGHRRKRERNFDADRVKKAPKNSVDHQSKASIGLTEDVSMLMDNLQFEADDDDDEVVEAVEWESELLEETRCINDATEDQRQPCVIDSRNEDTARDLRDDPELEAYEDIYRNELVDEAHADKGATLDDAVKPDGVEIPEYSVQPTNLFQQGCADDAVEYNNLCFNRGAEHVNSRYNELGDIALTNNQTEMERLPCNGTNHSSEYDEGLYGDMPCGHDDLNIHEGARVRTFDHTNSSQHLSPSNRLICDMGVYQIEVTPMISRRWRFF